MRVGLTPYDPSNDTMKQEVLDLLVEAFGAYESYYRLLSELAANPRDTLLYYVEDALAAHIQIVPYVGEVSEGTRLNVAYLYAVCTAKRLRGQGIMHEMLTETLRRLPEMGYDLAALVPAEESLIAYYEQYGFILMSGEAVQTVPTTVVPAVRPGTVATEYLSRAALLDDEVADGSGPSGLRWMAHPLRSTLPPLTTPIEAPMQ